MPHRGQVNSAVSDEGLVGQLLVTVYHWGWGRVVVGVCGTRRGYPRFLVVFNFVTVLGIGSCL